MQIRNHDHFLLNPQDRAAVLPSPGASSTQPEPAPPATQILSATYASPPFTASRSGFATAFGKTILLGEHAVVYGWPALAAALEQYVAVSVQEWTGPAWVVAPDIGLDGPLEITHAASRSAVPSTCPAGAAPGTEATSLHRALTLALTLLDAPPSGLCLKIQGTIPVGRGAGSSAALTIASLRAIAAFLQRPLAQAQVLELGQRIEQEFHGRASGIDHTVAALGGVLEYARGVPPRLRPLRLGAPLPLLLVDAGAAPPTAHQVARVAEKLRLEPEPCQALFARIGGLVECGVQAITAGDLSTLAQLMNDNHTCLQALGVSSPALDTCVQAARAAGAAGAKLTGAGGGGLALALCPQGAASVAQELRAQGYTVYETCLKG